MRRVIRWDPPDSIRLLWGDPKYMFVDGKRVPYVPPPVPEHLHQTHQPDYPEMPERRRP